MPKRLFIALLALIAVSAACSSQAVETTADGELIVASGGDAMDSSDGDEAMDSSDGDEAMESSDGDVMSAPADGVALMFADTMSQAAAYNSARFEGRFRITGADPSTPDATVEMVISGAYDVSAESMELTIDLSELFAAGVAGGGAAEIPPGFDSFFEDPMQLITIGDEGWLKWSLVSLFTGQDDMWLALESDELGSATEDFGFSGAGVNPTDLLDMLAAADADVEDLGTEIVQGVETRHWRALLDVESLAADLDASDQAELEQQLGELASAAYPMDMWVGVTDGLLYRYEISLDGNAMLSPDAPAEASALVSFEFFDHGEPIGIAPPPPDQIIDGSSLFGLPSATT